MTDTGIFGGSFNPVHVAHLILAERVRAERGLDRVLFVPAGNPPHKPPRPMAAPEHRVRMLELALADNPRFELSRIEVDAEGPSYTLRTVRELKDRMGGEDGLYLILGGDSALDLPNWWHAEELAREVPMLVVARPGHAVEDGERELVERFGRQWWRRLRESRVDAPLLEISATEIRERVRAGKSIRYLVPEPVRRYIIEKELYRHEEATTG